MEFNYFGSTHIGKIKKINEDSFNAFVVKDTLFLIVADGIGSIEGFDIPSIIAVHEFKNYIEKNCSLLTKDTLKKHIEEGMYWINRILLAYKKANDKYNGLGTTFTVCAITKDDRIVVGHVGNTRLYLLRGQNMVQMTKDHTEAQALYEQKKIQKEELIDHPNRAVLTKAIGVWENVDFDVFAGEVQKEDILLLCSDGIFNLLSEEEINSIILEAGNSKQASEWLIKGANERGGIDNEVALLSYINF